MPAWCKRLSFDPVPGLLAAEMEPLTYFVRRDLLGNGIGPVDQLWWLFPAQRLLQKQQTDGSWKYPGARSCHNEDYEQLETYRNLAILVEKYGMDRREPAIVQAADFLLARVTDEGDLRGIYGNQYTPNYTGIILELLVKAGFHNDKRVLRSFEWLLGMRHNDGGWALPCLTTGDGLNIRSMTGPLIRPDRSKPFSHMVTGMVLRAFAAHPKFKKSEEAQEAADLLATRFFKRDAAYSGRHTPEFWTKFSFPFWFTDLLTSLDSLSKMGFPPDHPQIQAGLEWFKKRQRPGGLWRLKLLRTGGGNTELWVALAISRIFRRFYG